MAVLVTILGSYLMIVLDISIVITGLPRIQQSLGFSPTQLSWVHSAYTLAFGGLLLLGARAGDILGRRRVFILGLMVFTAASVVIGMAQSALWMLTARAVQGAGSALLAPSTLALLTTRFPHGPDAPAPSACTEPPPELAPASDWWPVAFWPTCCRGGLAFSSTCRSGWP
ncbi:MFS transporter [Insolitispirillum peregrinum]|uniref:Major Facilitator Superfamily protein n=1 Tax=Insolitispirillum peregrinum TaxID=80876 RepID=A0A1N7IRV9_9PROT|nr:MFS transporter [Insolitispirillum peregrinum]SIS39711.1 Major Facilitator Superfamily protein [Insolitispirillum peregrinum]